MNFFDRTKPSFRRINSACRIIVFSSLALIIFQNLVKTQTHIKETVVLHALKALRSPKDDQTTEPINIVLDISGPSSGGYFVNNLVSPGTNLLVIGQEYNVIYRFVPLDSISSYSCVLSAWGGFGQQSELDSQIVSPPEPVDGWGPSIQLSITFVVPGPCAGAPICAGGFIAPVDTIRDHPDGFGNDTKCGPPNVWGVFDVLQNPNFNNQIVTSATVCFDQAPQEWKINGCSELNIDCIASLCTGTRFTFVTGDGEDIACSSIIPSISDLEGMKTYPTTTGHYIFSDVALTHELLHQERFLDIWETFKPLADSVVAAKRWPCASLAALGTGGIASAVTDFANATYTKYFSQAVNVYQAIPDSIEEQDIQRDPTYLTQINEIANALSHRCLTVPWN
jgi:hypothetical protein